MRKSRLILVALLVTACGVLAQQRPGQGWGGGEGWRPEYEVCRTAREAPSHSTGTPLWTNEPGFESDVFTFTRIRRDRSRALRTAGDWSTDFPDSDLNFSYRLQTVTSVRSNPDGRVLRLTEPELFDFPWIYMVEPGSLILRDEEVAPLRKYLENGGVLMADDFWGVRQWETFERQIKRVLPGRSFVELQMTNQLFHCVFDIKVSKNQLQTPNIQQGIRSLNPRSREYKITWENYHDEFADEGARDMHVRAIFDDHGRIMVIATHNCDNGDGWEREGEDDGFFHEFSEKRAYPLGVNIIFYLMSH
jgi:hypothetical protein